MVRLVGSVSLRRRINIGDDCGGGGGGGGRELMVWLGSGVQPEGTMKGGGRRRGAMRFI